MRRIVHVMMVASLIGVACIAAPSVAFAAGPNPNETVDTTVTADALAQSLVGPGVAISNVAYTGAAAAKGTFTFTDPTVTGMAQGVILSSGNAADVVGPNSSDSFSTDWTGAGDPDLDALSGFPTYDAAALEFDFVPAANQVTFQYAFSSDEYSEWVNTPYNDVFAFFVNGTNCAEVRQVAGDPASPFVPVAINNINNSNPIQSPAPTPMRPDLFRDNSYTGGATPIDLESDGITRVLTCQSPVNPGVVNHMKLAISDASDGVYDSNVFIAAGSLVSNGNPTADLGVSPAGGAAPLDVTATIEGHDPNNALLTYSLDWGDGTGVTGVSLPDLTATAPHTYLYGGTYPVTLTVSNGTLTGTDHEDVDVTGPPPTNNPTTTTLSSSANPSALGQSVTLKATVVRTPPGTGVVKSGTLNFFDNASLLASKAVKNGVATFVTKGLLVGNHPITATFTGTVADAASDSNPVTQTVAPASTAVTLTTAPSISSVFGQNVKLKAVVKRVAPASGVPSGTVDFYDELGPLATGVPLSGSGVATFALKSLPLGLHGLHADFSGSATDEVSHATVTFTVNPANTATTLAASPKLTTAGHVVTLTATVKALAPGSGVPGGSVTFYDNGQPSFSAPLVAGKAVVKTSTLGVGAHSFTVLYSGAGGYNGSQSVAVVVTIN